MPGFAHVVISLGFSLILYKFTGGRFSYKHGIIFTVNSFFGPDMFGFLEYRSNLYVFFHGYGWFLAAIPLAFAWSIFTRYRLRWKPFKILKRDPEREAVITIPEVFCLVAAGGIFHQFVDLIGHPPFITYEGESNVPWGVVWFGGNNWFSVEAIWATGMFPCGNTFGFWESWVYIGLMIGITVFLIMFVMQRNKKSYLYSSLIIIAMGILPLAISYLIPDFTGFDVTAEGVNYYGDPTAVPITYRLTGGEADLGIYVYFGLFFFVPLVLLYFSWHGIPFVKLKGFRAKMKQIKAEERKRTLKRLREYQEKNS